jgi:hypothetical protein
MRKGLVVSWAVILLAPTAWGQEGPGPGPAQPQQKLSASQQRSLLAIDELIAEAKGYDDKALEIRVRAEAADLTWPFTPDRARQTLIDAFDDAAALKTDPVQDKPSNPNSWDTQAAAAERFQLLSQVIRFARKHDASLAAKLMARLNDLKGDSRLISRDGAERISERGAAEIDLAQDALNAGNESEAIGLLRQSLSQGRSNNFIAVLDQIRRIDPAAADRLFLDAVNSELNSGYDPNGILMLGLYLFTPGRYSIHYRYGQPLIGPGINMAAGVDVPPSMARPYLEAAAAVITRYQLGPDGPSLPGRVALKEFALTQLLPLFQRYLPDRVEALREQLSDLARLIPDAAAARQNAAASPPPPGPLMPDERSVNDVIEAFDQIPGDKARDSRYVDAVVSALNSKELERARALAAKISNTAFREPLIEIIDLRSTLGAITRGELDEGRRIAAAGLTGERLALAYYSLSATWFQKGDSTRGQEFASEAFTAANRIDDPERRGQVYVYIAAVLVKSDSVRAFQAAEAAIKSIDTAEHFDVRRSSPAFRITKPDGMVVVHSFSVPGQSSLISLISELTRSDLNRTLELARSLRSAQPRALSVLAACRVGLTIEIPKQPTKDKNEKQSPKKKEKNAP